MPLIFKPQLDKIVELLLYLAHMRPDADKYQAVKFFYLADKEHLNRYGRPITFETYYALDYGPVASTAKELLEQQPGAMKAAGIKALPFETEEVPGKTPDKRILYIRAPLRPVDRQLFSKSDLKVFDEVIEKYGKLSFDELYNITHEHFAYKNAWQKRGFFSKRAKMSYEDMIDDQKTKEKIVQDIEPVSANMR